MRKILAVEDLSELNMQKVSTLYRALTFLGNFCNSGKFLFSNTNIYTSKISMAKAILDIFVENKDAKHYSK